MTYARLVLALSSVATAACATTGDRVDGDGVGDSFLAGKADSGDVAEGTAEALGVLRVANEASLELLDADVGLDTRAAVNIVTYRLGDDGIAGTTDDETFEALAELDAIPYVGPVAFVCLLAYARDHGWVVPVDPLPRPTVLHDAPISIDGGESSVLFVGTNLYVGARRSINATVSTVDLARYALGDHGPIKVAQTAEAQVSGLGALGDGVLIYNINRGFDVARGEPIPWLAPGDATVEGPTTTGPTAGRQITADGRGNVYASAAFEPSWCGGGTCALTDQIQISVRSPSVGWMARLTSEKRPSARGPFGVNDQWLVVNNRSALTVYDVTDPANPVEHATIAMDPGVELLGFRPLLAGNKVLVVSGARLYAFDVVTGARIATLDFPESVQGLRGDMPSFDGHTLYIGGARTIYTIELSDHGQLSFVDSFAVTTDPAVTRVGTIHKFGSKLYAIWHHPGGHHLTTIALPSFD